MTNEAFPAPPPAAGREHGDARDPAGGALALLAAATPAVAVFASKALVVVLALFAAFGMFGWLREGRAPRPPLALLALACGLLVLGGTSVLWAEEPAGVASQLWRLAAIFAGGLLALAALAQAPVRRRRRALLAFAVGQATAMALLAFELASGGGLTAFFWRPVRAFDFNAGASALALFVWPATLALGRRAGRIGLALLMLAAMIVIGLKSDSFAVGAGLVLGAAAAVAAVVGRARFGRLMAAFVVAAVLAAPLIADAIPRPAADVPSDTWVPHGVFPRLIIWDYVTERIAERPVLGWGLNAARFFSGANEQVHTEGAWKMLAEALPLHPHNAVLQWWLELGVLGALLGAAFLAWLIVRATDSGLTPAVAATGAGQIATGLLIAAVGFGAWQSWWLATFWIAGAFTAAGRNGAGA